MKIDATRTTSNWVCCKRSVVQVQITFELGQVGTDQSNSRHVVVPRVDRSAAYRRILGRPQEWFVSAIVGWSLVEIQRLE